MRQLAVEESGSPHGAVVFLLHGTPGGRRGPKPRAIHLHRQNIRLISYDRPGYGESDRDHGRRVVDAADDVEAIADALGIDRFAVIGRSGGGPHALACAAKLVPRVTAAAALVSLAPRDPVSEREGFDWFAGMTADNRRAYRLVETHPERLDGLREERSGAVGSDTAALLPILDEGLHASDRRIIGAIRSKFDETYQAALSRTENWYGWHDDLIALGDLHGWGFDVREIKIPVLLWHGAEDHFTPVSHSRWLAEHIPTAVTSIETGASHFSAVERLPELLPRVLALADSAVLSR
ncbi:MAG TPA: alpha/beta fold hydrolase [Actinocrinis sp.]|uniref:alpha/beta fold hydrolase n=1 Tax=Actinocrinis sp. TaxID=1920516 RepID=UPI002DDD3C73|nr:alpha/beta fold hydrolase [Actinocrinis sp.]HEV3169184.1 alpha/beta fold hydrolase [Actinocrinis sp.]